MAEQAGYGDGQGASLCARRLDQEDALPRSPHARSGAPCQRPFQRVPIFEPPGQKTRLRLLIRS